MLVMFTIDGETNVKISRYPSPLVARILDAHGGDIISFIRIIVGKYSHSIFP